MIYQGMEVTFSQPTTAQFNALMMELGRTNMQVRTNSDNLMKMGKDMTIMGKNDTWFGTEITKLKNLISTGGQGMNRQQVENIVEDYHGDDIALFYSNHADQEQRLTDAFNDRQMIDAKANATQAEHGKFNDTLTKIGKDMTDLGKSLAGKAGVNHTHPDGGGLGISLPILVAGGIAAYFLLKGKKK